MFQDPQQEFEMVGASNLHVPLSKQIMVFLNPNLRNVCNLLMAETTLGSKNYEVPADEPLKKRKNTELGDIARFARNTTICQVVIHHTWPLYNRYLWQMASGSHVADVPDDIAEEADAAAQDSKKGISMVYQ